MQIRLMSRLSQTKGLDFLMDLSLWNRGVEMELGKPIAPKRSWVAKQSPSMAKIGRYTSHQTHSALLISEGRGWSYGHGSKGIGGAREASLQEPLSFAELHNGCVVRSLTGVIFAFGDRNSMSCYGMLRYGTLCHVYYVIQYIYHLFLCVCNVLYSVMWCSVTLCYVMLCYVIICNWVL